MSQGKKVGIIMTYNCAPLIEDLYRRIPKDVYDEIILVDDGSEDNSFEVGKSLGIKSWSHEHRGYGGNLKFGLERALEMGALYMVEIHGDGQFDPAIAPEVLKKLEQGADFVLGSRFTNPKQAREDGMSFARFWANRGLSFFDRLILRVPLTEFHNGFRAYTRRMLQKFDFTLGAEDYLYSFEIIARAVFFGCRIEEVPVRANYHGEHTSVSIKKAAIYSFQTFFTLFQYLLSKIGVRTKLFKNSSYVPAGATR